MCREMNIFQPSENGIIVVKPRCMEKVPSMAGSAVICETFKYTFVENIPSD